MECEGEESKEDDSLFMLSYMLCYAMLMLCYPMLCKNLSCCLLPGDDVLA